jgi:hypothetical protein
MMWKTEISFRIFEASDLSYRLYTYRIFHTVALFLVADCKIVSLQDQGSP